ncbi:SCO family protein [Marinobacter bohaiensis]|uniref:SCO family protein n=1 Tax=Marinobacter bohaiensis TaxID=2201898 RepID=UPI000DAD1D47|nr:SCO family protein [Marinobacter bohaiensis]
MSRRILARTLIGGLALLLSACQDTQAPFNGKDISGVMPDLAFELRDTAGQTVTQTDYDGQVRLLFFGYTSCPDVCPTTLAELNRVMTAMPTDLRDDVTALFVSVDPKRDTPQRLDQYVHFFGDRIVGLTGPEPTLRTLAKRYRTTFGYGDADEQGNYDVSHSSAIYVFDQAGEVRLLLRPGMTRDAMVEDLSRLVRQGTS